MQAAACQCAGDAQPTLMNSNQDRVERKLAAIFAADVGGFARLRSADENGTFRALTAQGR
jgi:hypothetical protein